MLQALTCGGLLASAGLSGYVFPQMIHRTDWLAVHVLPPSQVDRIVDLVLHLDEVEDASALSACLARE